MQDCKLPSGSFPVFICGPIVVWYTSHLIMGRRKLGLLPRTKSVSPLTLLFSSSLVFYSFL